MSVIPLLWVLDATWKHLGSESWRKFFWLPEFLRKIVGVELAICWGSLLYEEGKYGQAGIRLV
jgi:hypothetical protein